MANFIFIKSKRYNYYDTYSNYRDALKEARRQRKKTKSQYFILTIEKGFPIPYKVHKLYLTKVIRFGW
jgi:restriction endonuclease S subunit